MAYFGVYVYKFLIAIGKYCQIRAKKTKQGTGKGQA